MRPRPPRSTGVAAADDRLRVRPQAVPASSPIPAPVAVETPPSRIGWWGRRVSTQQVLSFSEQLLTLLNAGLPIDRALHVSLGTIEHPYFKEVMQGVFLEVEKGNTLADAFARYPQIFPRLYVNMVRAGEEGGVLPVVLERLIEFYTRSIEFRSFLVTSSIYPALLFVFGSAALLALMVFVLPKFGQIFADMGQALPGPAAVLIAIGDFLSAYGVWILGVVLAAMAGFQYALRDPLWRDRWQQLVLKVPMIGLLLLKIQLARVCRTWGTLLASGVPILTGMRIVKELSDNLPLHRAMDRLTRAVQEGHGVSRPMLADPFFPRMLGQLAAIGEESGALDTMLIKVADQYENDIRKTTRNLVALFEPAMILFMGGLIGLIVVSMLTAIFSINDMPL